SPALPARRPLKGAPSLHKAATEAVIHYKITFTLNVIVIF
ncbi:MAG: hypothetical protein ACD_39C02124G0014, partial [uncultured bacterium]